MSVAFDSALESAVDAASEAASALLSATDAASEVGVRFTDSKRIARSSSRSLTTSDPRCAVRKIVAFVTSGLT